MSIKLVGRGAQTLLLAVGWGTPVVYGKAPGLLPTRGKVSRLQLDQGTEEAKQVLQYLCFIVFGLALEEGSVEFRTTSTSPGPERLLCSLS